MYTCKRIVFVMKRRPEFHCMMTRWLRSLLFCCIFIILFWASFYVLFSFFQAPIQYLCYPCAYCLLCVCILSHRQWCRTEHYKYWATLTAYDKLINSTTLVEASSSFVIKEGCYQGHPKGHSQCCSCSDGFARCKVNDLHVPSCLRVLLSTCGIHWNW